MISPLLAARMQMAFSLGFHTFQLMVVSGVFMLGVAAWFWWAWWRDGRRERDWGSRRWLLVALALATPLGFLALESGWVVTEVGRQPWIIYRVMRTQEAVTPIVEVFVSLMGFVLLYAGLIATLALLLRRMARGEGETAELGQERYDAPD